MAVQQVNQSFQNDGNFSLLDLKDVKYNGNLMRIETFRCSHPDNEFGKTVVGTFAKHLCGDDHLKEESNKVFRHLFSVEYDNQMKGILEIRENFEEDGSWNVLIRDIDPLSDSFAYCLKIKTSSDYQAYKLEVEIFKPIGKFARKDIHSPLEERISNSLVIDILHISGKNHELIFSTDLVVTKNNYSQIDLNLKEVREYLNKFDVWSKNVGVYQRFGDFRDKCIHDGTNLTGNNPELASEFVLIRAYRSSLIMTGILFDDQMYNRESIYKLNKPLSVDSKPGVYTPFLNAYILGIEIYQLGIDKVHSDYGGVPMKNSPGSRLENGIEPLVDSDRANRTLAELAVIFYQPQLATVLVGRDALLNYSL